MVVFIGTAKTLDKPQYPFVIWGEKKGTLSKPIAEGHVSNSKYLRKNTSSWWWIVDGFPLKNENENEIRILAI